MNKRMLVLAGIVISAAVARLVPHPPNVTPITAMALFGGAYLANRRLAYLLPLAAMLLSDVTLGFLIYGTTLLRSQPVVYACILATVAMGRLIRNRLSAWQVGGVTLASSVMFYLVTNFVVWASGHLYPRTWDGLMTCYIAAIPFFRNSLAGDMVFSAVLFGGFILLEAHVTGLSEETELSPV